MLGGGQWKNQNEEIAPISHLLLYQWQVRGHTGNARTAYSGERCIKSPA